MDAIDRKWLTTAEAAVALERSVGTIARWTRTGLLRAYRVAGRLRYDARDIELLRVPRAARRTAPERTS